MIEELKRYGSLRPSGDPWLGEIPSHWSQKRLWSISSPRVERNPGNLPLLSVFLDRGVIPYREGGGQVHAPSLDLSNYQVVHPGDFVLNNQQAWRGSVGVSRHHGIISPAYIVLRLNGELLPAYANYLFRCPRLVDQFVAASKGVGDIQRQVFWPFLRRVTVPIPSTTEQDAIVRFLDHANLRIDRYIRSKRRQVTLLNEQKQALIHRAVTGAFTDGQGEFVDRGVFLGKLPGWWPMHRAKYLFRQVVAPVPANAEQVTCFRDGQVTLRRNRRTTGFTEAIYELGYQGISKGQLVVHSMDGFAGAIGVSDSLGKCSPEYVILEPSTDGVHPEYYAVLLRHLALRGLFTALCPSVRERAPRVRFSDFGSFVLPKPTLEEQRSIVDQLREAGGEFDRALRHVREQLARAQEYRSRLITDAVTGQCDVRTAVLSLDESEDASPEVGTPRSLVAASDDLGDGEAA